MKLITLVLVIALMHVSCEGDGQITLKEKNAPLEKVLAAIEKQTTYVFLYDPDEVKAGPITIDVKNATLKETLEKCFKGLPVEWSVVGDNVLLKKKRPEIGNKAMRPDVNISGKVIDERGQPMTGVTVSPKHGTGGTQTDSNGVFSILAAKGDTLSFSFIGYKEKEIKVGEEPYVTVAMEVNPANPEQVVVIGYGSSRKKDLTGSVSVVDVKGMDALPFYTVDNALAGKAAGVDVTKTDGTPGGMVRVRIRGASSLLGGNDPLYVIDGVPVQVRNNFIEPGFQVLSPMINLVNFYAWTSGSSRSVLPGSYVNSLNSLGGLNPDDIASMTILKDASSAAIYGSKAANGVVIITTKAGSSNSTPRLELSYSSTVSTPYRTPHLLNASQYKTLLTEAAQNAWLDDTVGGPPYYHGELTSYVLDSANWFGSAHTNWIREVTRTTLSNNAGLALSGGGQGSKYFASIAYTSTPGVVRGTGYRRVSGKFNLENQIGSRLRVAANLLGGSTSQDVDDGVYTQAMMARPDIAAHDASGKFINFSPWKDFTNVNYGFLNPAALLTATNNARTVSLLGTLSASYEICKDLAFRSAVSLNMQNYNQRNYFPGYIDVFLSWSLPFYARGVSGEANSRFSNWFFENTLSYHKQLAQKHALNVVIGQSYESSKYSWSSASGGGFENDNFSNLSSADTMLSIRGDAPGSPQSYLLSFYARTNYSYADKYFFTFTGRADGSSKFGSDKLFGYFPSGALAWRLSGEKFLRSARWITDIKIRGSYGQTGNQNIGDQTKHTLYSSINYGGYGGLIPTVLGNKTIKPEIMRSTDIGVDIALFDHRLYATADHYLRSTSNAILTLPITPSSTYPVLTQNAAGIRNRGFEVSIGGDIVRNRHIKWGASFNITWNRTVISELSSTADVAQIKSPGGLEYTGTDLSPNAYSVAGNTALLKGQPLGLIMGSYVTGIIRTQAALDAYKQQLGGIVLSSPLHIGSPMFKLNPITLPYGYQSTQANVMLGNGAPAFFGGMTQELSYKRFDLQGFFTFSHGGHLLWAQHITSHAFFGVANTDVSMLDRYTPTHTNTNAPRLDLNAGIGGPTNLDVFSSSFFKLRSLVVSYHPDEMNWMKKTGLTGMRLFISATNVFTITKYPGGDPETSNDAYSVNGGYIEAGLYPAIRTFTFGLKAAFQ